jgi:hypothetical protein
LAGKSTGAVKFCEGWAHWNRYGLILLADDLGLCLQAASALGTLFLTVFEGFFVFFDSTWSSEVEWLFNFVDWLDITNKRLDSNISRLDSRVLDGCIDGSESGGCGEGDNEGESNGTHICDVKIAKLIFMRPSVQ